MKYLLRQSILTSLLLIALVNSAMAKATKVGDFYYTFSGTDATITAKSTTAGSSAAEYTGGMTIPSTVTYSGTTYTVTSIDKFAFYKCTGLTAITIANTVTSIGTSAFNGCTGLTVITIPNSVTEISASAFQGTSIAQVSLGTGVTTIGANAFYNCPITAMTCLASTPPTLGSDVFKSTDFTLTVPHGCKEAYATVWTGFSDIHELGGGAQATSLTFNKSKKFVLTGNSIQQSPAILPVEASTQNLTWTSSNTSVATIDESGTVTAITAGNTMITATTTDGSNITASYKLFVFVPGIPGDVNGDGDITIADANAIVDMYLKE